MRFCYSDGYQMALPAGHRFPMGKYAALREILLREGVLRAADGVAPEEADWSLVRQVHSEAYLSDLANGTLTPAAVRRLGLPWSPALVRRARLAVMGTLTAARMALEDGLAGNLAGGTHHAFPDRGEGFCVLNDVAIAFHTLRAERRIERLLVVDLDVHQGNGTAVCLAGVPGAFTFSMHGARNYPFQKERSWRDVPLSDGLDDAAYLGTLEPELEDALTAAQPDLIFYLAGVDVHERDRFGRLRLTRAGLAARDRLVLGAARRAGVPLAIVLSGGYAPTVAETADLHATVFRVAAEPAGSSGP